MLNQLFKRTVFLVGLIIVISMMFGMTVFASNENSRYIMDAEVMTSGHIGVLYIKGGTSSSGVISGGTLYFGKYDPVLKAWQDDLPVGEEATVAKEATLAIDSSGVCHVAYVTEDDKIAYVHTEGLGWSDPEIIESNNCNDMVGTLSGPDIAVDGNGKVHIVYTDTQGANDGYYKRPDGMYATNESDSFVKSVIKNCTGDWDAPEGWNHTLTSPLKIAVSDSDYCIEYKYQWKSKEGYSNWDTSNWFILQFKNSALDNGPEGATIYELISDGTNFYTLISQGGKYKVLNGTTEIVDTVKEASIYSADMTLDGSDIYYAAINGTSLLFYQDGTFIDNKVATTGILSSHNKCATVIANDKQYIVYTGSDTDNSLVITTITDDEVDEFLVPNVTNYQVTIDPNNGDTTIPMSVEDGTEITLPSASSLAVPEGTAFAGWKIGDDIYDAGDTYVVEEDITIEAQWYEIIETANCTITKPVGGINPDMNPVSSDSEKYTVTIINIYLYESSYPNISSEDEYESGKEYAFRFEFTANEGYIFTDDTTYTVNGDATSCYGAPYFREIRYTTPVTYTVTVDPNNGEDTQEISGLEIGTNNCQISSPTSYGFTIPDGYEFAGWKIGDVIYNAGETFDVTGNMTAVAQWNAIEYQIIYNLGEGIVSGVNPTTYTIESDSITLINPSKNDYYFAGWTGTGLSDPTQAVTIPQGSTGDREYTAQWIETTKITTITLDGEYVAPVVGETIPTITTGILSVNEDESLKDIIDVNYIKWQKRTGEGYWDFEDATGTFEAGEKYRLRMLFYVADESQSSYAFPSTSVTVNMTGTELSNWQKDSTSLGVWTEDVEPTVPAPTTYTISYNANSGTGTKESEEVESGDTITLPSSDTFTAPKGYEFYSWDIIDEDANAVIEANKAPGYEYVVNKNIRIEAEWKLIEPAGTVTAPTFESAEVGYSSIEKKAIEVKLTNKAVIKGDTVQLISSNTTNFNTICTLPNEELEGPGTWNSASNFAIGPKNNLSAGTYTTTITIKAKGLDDNTYTLGEAEVSFTVTEPAPTIINTITFVGGNDFVAGNEVGTWTVPSDANYELTSSGTIFVKDLTANQTLTASDKYIGGHSYILVFTGVMPKTGFVYGNSDDLVFTANGVSVETTSEPQVMEQGIGRINFSVAEVAPSTYAVTLNPNGGSVTPTSITINENGTYGELPTPTNENDVNFLGWYKSKVVHDDNTCFDDTTVPGWVIRATPSDDMDYHYSGVYYFNIGDLLVFDITIDGLENGATIERVDVNDEYLPSTDYEISEDGQNVKGYTYITSSQYHYVLDFIDVEVTKNVNYTINEFALYKSKVTSADTIENSNHTLIAAWSTNGYVSKYTVTYDANGGTGTMSDETSQYYIFPSCDFTAPTGKTFDKWEVNGKKYKVGDTLTLTEDITVKATWKNKSTSSGSSSGGGGGSSSSSYKVTTKIENGTISPANASVKKNADQEFTFKVNDGYEITDVLVDGKSVGVVDSYKLEKVTAKHIIEVKTSKKSALSSVDDWAKEEMLKAEEKGLIPETFNGKDATKTITRLDFAAVAVKLYEVLSGKKAEPVAVNPFTDTNDEYVLKAYALGITVGTSETTFTPNAEITREQMATMLTRALSKAGINTKIDIVNVIRFADDNELSDWARSSVYFMAKNEIIKGIGDNRFQATGNAKVEEAIAIVLRSVEIFGK